MSREVVLAPEDLSEDIKPDNSEDIISVLKSESDSKIVSDTTKSQASFEVDDDPESPNSASYEDEEDIPSDFFDDFSNQDFMAGLDIVDAWDEDELVDDKEKVKKTDESSDLRQRNRQSNRRGERTRRRYSRSPFRSNRNDYNRRPRRSKERSRASRDRNRKRKSKDRKSKDKPKEKEPKECETEEQDHRRDPEKTKRDIQKDKDKCAKNKEAKIISEKLKVVETGLVPPGTEMEVDLKELTSVVSIKEPEKKSDSVRDEKVSVHKEKSGALEGEALHEERVVIREERQGYGRRRRSGSTSGDIFHSRYEAREKRYSTHRTSRNRDKSYERRLRLRSRSPYRRRSKSRSSYRARISTEKRMYVEERRKVRRYRDSSPTVLRRKSRDRTLDLSPVSNLSEREMWLRQRDHHKRDRKLSCSPVSDTESVNRKRSQDFLEELAHKLNSNKKKKSFLKEIHERLNEPSKLDPRYPVGSTPGPVPAPMRGTNPMPGQMHVPHPVPGPGFMPGPPHQQFFPQQLDPSPQYDQQFFIGQPDMFHNSNPYAQSYMVPTPVNTVLGSVPSVTPLMVPQPLDSPINRPYNSSLKNNVDILEIQKVADAQKEKDQEAITKLFEDKKISLSDFLSMSAKYADPTKPVNVQKKIKVIALCQDAIKALGGDSKLSGRFFHTRTFREAEKKEETKYQSVLRKIPVVRFCFTTPSKGGDDKSSLQSTLNKLLTSLGLGEEYASLMPKPSLSPVSSEASVKSSNAKPLLRKYDPILGAKFQMKMCQTDPVKCNICEIRKARRFVDQGTQCSIKTYEMATQITDEETQRFAVKVPAKDSLKTQSFAHLTPAQLLAIQSVDHDALSMKDIFPAARMLTPPPPDISPDKQILRANISNNDSFPNRSEYLDRFSSPNISNNVNRPGGFKLPSIFDKVLNPYDNPNRPLNHFENMSRPNSFDGGSPIKTNFDNRSNLGNMQQMQQFNNDNMYRGNVNFNQRMSDDDLEYDAPPNNNYGGNLNSRAFLTANRGNFLPGPYGGRKFF